MRPLPLLGLAGVALAVTLGDATAAPRGKYSRIGELPGEKTPEVLRERERNPFMRRETKITEPNTPAATEESRIREVFAGMAVTGIVRGGGGEPAVLMGELILKPGASLPALIEGQTEKLTVGRITDSQVEIVFLEADERAEPRRILIPVDLRPRVVTPPPVVQPDKRTPR